MKHIVLLLICLFVGYQVIAQREQGSWQDYLSFTNATKLAVADNKVYCVTEGGLFYLDTDDNSLNKFSGMDGLSDFGIKTIAYSTQNQVLVVAYQNSNIDLVYESEIINLSDIKRKNITGDKSINNITFNGSEAYLSCGFGIVVINLDKQEVKDTYYIGEGGSALKVNDIEFYNQNIYAATDHGILKAFFEGTNLLDFNSWIKEENILHANDKFSHLVIHAEKLIANYTPGSGSNDESYIFENETWTSYLSQVKNVYDMASNGDYLAVTGSNEIYVLDKSHLVVGKINSYKFGDETISSISSRCTNISSDGLIWIADYEHALVKVSGENYESLYPPGPMDNEVFFLGSNNSDIWVTPGGRNDWWGNVWQEPRFQRFSNNEWKYYSNKEIPELDGVHDIVCIAVDPLDENHFFAGSWGGGVLEFRNDEFVQRYTNHNSPLQSALPQQPDEPYVRIGGLDFDSEGNLWITNSEVTKNLKKLTPSGEWESFVLPEVANSNNIGQVIVNSSDDKWILVPRGNDAYVVDKTGGQKKRLLVTSYFNNGEDEIFNRMNDVYSIAEDLEEAIWIGTSKGVAVYHSPHRIWSSESFYASQPGLDLKDGIYHPLLETETVTAIAVDGANRKWLGTKNSGVYLISESGEEETLHFTAENSPLLSNNITAIAINQKNGEVFFGTGEGLISYQGEAIGGKDSYSNVYVYPNPVRENYQGPVTVTGLIENTDVKITDISGNLVFKTTSLGGQAVWDGKSLNGNRVKTGVYLVFCNDELGEETHITKLLFIH
ncbi:MAG: T9SS type A sorting domain-containing protein [Bacteroidota bacterium]